MSSRRTVFPYLVLALTLLGAVLRLWELGSQSLWLDEVFTARVAPLDLAGILSAIRSDLDTPPLHPFVVHAFLALGNSEFVLRLPSAIASILCIPLMYVVARRLLGWRTGLLAAALMASSPFAVYYAQEARMYGLVLMFALLTLYCLLRALDADRLIAALPTLLPKGERAPVRAGGRNRIWWLGFILSGALGLYAHFFGFFVLGLYALYAAMRLAVDWRAGQKDAVLHHGRYLLLSLVAIAVLYMPWLPVLLNFFSENYAANPYGQSWQANLGPRTAINMFTLMLGGYWAPVVARWGTRILFVIGLLFMARRRPLVAGLVVLTTALPFGIISALNPGHFVTERYFIFMLPMLIMGMAEALRGFVYAALALLQRIAAHRGGFRPHLYQGVAALPMLLAFLAIPLLCGSGLTRYFTEPPKPAWRPLARYVAGNVPPGDLIVVATFPHWDKEPLQHYLMMGGRRVVYAAETKELRQILADEHTHPWWIVYAGTERRLGWMMSRGVGANFTVVPFDYLAVVRRNGDSTDALADALVILKTLVPRIPGPYQSEVQRVIKHLSTPGADSGQPIAPPLPTTVR